MPNATCLCGRSLEGGDEEQLFAALRAHVDEAHADLGLDDQQLRNFLEAHQRLTGGTERLPEIGEVELHDLTPDRLDNFLRFFDHDAFADNPGWASCYCLFHHIGGQHAPDWGRRSAKQNREEMAERIRRGATTGVLAYVGGRPAAWCNASIRSAFPEHAGGSGDDDRIGSIACFVVAPPYRRHGLSARLLDAACDLFRHKGLGLAEAYPRRETQGDAAAYHGPLELFTAAGFEPVREEEGVVVVQKRLG